MNAQHTAIWAYVITDRVTGQASVQYVPVQPPQERKA